MCIGCLGWTARWSCVLVQQMSTKIQVCTKKGDGKNCERSPLLGFCGNLLMNRLAGANIELVTKDEYSRLGSEVMVMELCVINCKNKCLGFRQYMHTTAWGIVYELVEMNEWILSKGLGKKPYLIPVGGSNALGSSPIKWTLEPR